MDRISTTSIRVLHVDDEPGFAGLTATHLERQDDRFTVKTVTSANEGLDRLADADFDCIIADYDLPGQDGIEFLEGVRVIYPELPFILLTGNGSEEVASDAISAGVTEYLQKAGDADQYIELANCIQNSIDRADRRRERDLKARAIDEAPVGILYTDPSQEDNPIIYANEQFEEITGYAKDEVLGRNCRFLQGEDTDPETITEMREEIDAGEPVAVELRNYTKDGTEFWNRVTLSPLRDDAGEITHYIGFQQDITDRKKREQELKTTRARFRALTENTDHVAITIDDASQIQYVNDTVETVLGYTPEELVGESLLRIVPERFRDMHREAIVRYLEDGTKALNWDWIELPGLHKDGHEVPLGISFGEAIIDGNHYFTALVRDITERKRQEDTLDDLNDSAQTLMEAPDPQTVADSAVEIAKTVLDQSLNTVWLYDTADDLLRPAAWTDEVIALLDDIPTYDGSSLSWQAFEAGEMVVYNDIQSESKRYNRETPIESELILPLGEYGVMNIGSTEAASFDSIDISLAQVFAKMVEAALVSADRERELRSQREALQRQNQRLEKFANIVSHDLRNPLNVASGRLELARTERDSAYLEDIAHAHDRMEALIDDVLALSKAGNQVSELDTVDLETVSESCWRNVQTVDATLVTATNRTILADRSPLQQLLENLMRNAVEHGGDDVTITVGDLGDTGFYVADDGPGIATDDREEIFESGHSTSEGGTGLGLAIVKEIADAHDWEISVTDSDAGGARFEITGVRIE